MSNDLLDIFKEEANDYLKGLNEGLLKLEMSKRDEREVILTEMNRMVHSMKGAARAVGLGMVETISHYMEEIFHAALHDDLTITPGMGDTLYDGLDLIQNTLDAKESDDAIVAEILANLEAIVTGARMPDDSNLLQTDSAEIHVITDEMAVHEEPAKTQTHQQNTVSGHVSDELLSIFWIEVQEYLTILNDALLKVEMSKEDERDELIREMNRVAHSMKGAARAVGIETIETISHHIEELFQQALTDELDITPHVADILYDGLDLIKEIIEGNAISDDILVAVLMQMTRIVDGTERGNRDIPLSGIDPVPPAEETPEIIIPPALTTSNVDPVGAPTMLVRSTEESLRVSVNKLDQLMADTSELLLARLQGENRHKMLNNLRREHIKWQREWRTTRSAYIRLARRIQDNPDNLSSELLTVFRFLETNEDYLTRSNRELAALNQVIAQDNMHLTALGEQLQERVSSLRMMPFESIVGGFQRMARDVARDVGKQLHLEIRGVSVDIDKTVLDALKDPLIHLLRNAIDHGLETPLERERLGKSPIGYVGLSVEQRGSEIVIEVTDDGRGLDVNRIRHKALERDLISTQEAQQLTDDDIQMLVFQSGFTTTEEVTPLSGRGLGMDIVRTRIESMRGRVSVTSQRGVGTTVTINVPVSLTRIRVITMRVGDERYAIPSNMVERMEIFPTDIIFTAEGQEMLNINGRPMPLISLGAILDTPIVDERGDFIKIVAVRTTERAIAFEVDELFNEIELVLKPLGHELVNAPFVAGAALLGTGDIIIVLDVNDLVRRATGSSLKSHQRPMVRRQSNEQRALRVLVVDDSITTRTLEKNILEAVGFEVHVAIDGVEAWHNLSDIAPDVIVCDVEMPKMNGLELTRLIKSTPHTRDLPVILLTSLGKPEQREAGLAAGANAYLVKSRFDQLELLETIQSVL